MKPSILRLLTPFFLVGSAAMAQVQLPSNHPSVTFRASTTTVPAGSSLELMLDGVSGGALVPHALTGAYSRMPVENFYHSVTITHEGGSRYRWTHQGGSSWELTLDPSGTHFDTGPDNPYFNSYPQFREVRILAGDGEAAGLEFLGERYMRPLTTRLAGTYNRLPVENAWQSGQLEIIPGRASRMRWRNSAGVSWSAAMPTRTYENGLEKTDRLVTGTDNPYPGQHFELVWSGHDVTGFRFNGELYTRAVQPMGTGMRLGTDPDGLVQSLYHYPSGRTFTFPVSPSPAGVSMGTSVRRAFRTVDESGQPLPAGAYWAYFVYFVDLGSGPVAVQTGASLTLQPTFTPGRIAHSFNRNLGADPFTGNFSLYGEASKWTSGSTNAVTAKANTVANVSLFGVSREAFRFEADGTLRLDGSAVPATCRALVRIGGLDFVNVSTNQLSVYRSMRFTWGILSARRTFLLAGFIPMTVDAAAGLQTTGSVSLSADVAERKVSLSAGPSASVFGAASAGVGIWVASAGVYADLDLFNSSLQFPISVDADLGLSASMFYRFLPVSVSLGLYAEVFFGPRYELPVFSWSSPHLEQWLALY